MVKRAQRLIVALNGIRIGELSKDRGGGMSFGYDTSWLATAGCRPVSLSLPLRQERYQGAVVFNFFDNLLPDNEAIRNRIQARFHVESKHPFDLLRSIGMDCIGAVQLYADSDAELPSVQSVAAEPLTDADIAKLLQGYREAPLGMEQDWSDFRISLAGAQEKTALLWYQQQWCRPHGTTPTSHIIKLPIGMIQAANIDLSESCENEWLCLQLVKALGLPAANAEIANFSGQKALIVERFDRRWSKDDSWLMRLPQEDMCQALGVAPSLKYQADGGPGVSDVMQLLTGSTTALVDRETFLKAQIVFWLLAAIDGHAKNFSLFLHANNAYQLTPLYDVISAYPFLANKSLSRHKLKMAMALIGKNKQYHWDKIQRRHFISTAKATGFSQLRAEAVLQEVASQAEAAVNTVAKQLPPNFPMAIADAIFSGVIESAARL